MPNPIQLATLLLLAASAPAFAHHGWSSYDATKVIRVEAPPQAITWGNPHGTAKIMYKKKQWDVVLAPVTRMEARGLRQEMMTGGKKVTLVGYPRLDGTPEMRIETVIANGKTVELR